MGSGAAAWKGYYIPAVVAEAIAQEFNGGSADDNGDGYLDDWSKATLFEGLFKTTAAMFLVVGQGVKALNDFIKHKPNSIRLTIFACRISDDFSRTGYVLFGTQSCSRRR